MQSLRTKDGGGRTDGQDMKEEPSAKWRLIVITVGCFQALTTGGVICGWSALVPVLIEDGLYGDRCISITKNGCEDQYRHLHLAFVAACTSAMVANLLLGILFDRMGPRWCLFISHVSIVCGALSIGMAQTRFLMNSSVDWFMLGLCMVGFGGTGVQLANVHISNLFPRYKAAITCMIVGSVQLSFFVFSIFRVLHDGLSLTKTQIFLGWAVVGLVNLVLTLFVTPDEPYATADETQATSPTLSDKPNFMRRPSSFKYDRDDLLTGTPKLLGRMETGSSQMQSPPKLHPGPHRPLADRSLRFQLRTGMFWALTGAFSVATLWCNYIVGSIQLQIDAKDHLRGGSSVLLWLFNLLLPAGAFVTPFLGCLMEMQGFTVTMFVLIGMGFTYSVLLFLDNFYAMVTSFALYSAFRSYLFSFIYAYLGSLFGFNHFGVLSGVMFTVAGVFGLLQSVMLTSDFTKIYIVQALSYAGLVVLPIWKLSRERRQVLARPDETTPLKASMESIAVAEAS